MNPVKHWLADTDHVFYHIWVMPTAEFLLGCQSVSAAKRDLEDSLVWRA